MRPLETHKRTNISICWSSDVVVGGQDHESSVDVVICRGDRKCECQLSPEARQQQGLQRVLRQRGLRRSGDDEAKGHLSDIRNGHSVPPVQQRHRYQRPLPQLQQGHDENRSSQLDHPQAGLSHTRRGRRLPHGFRRTSLHLRRSGPCRCPHMVRPRRSTAGLGIQRTRPE